MDMNQVILVGHLGQDPKAVGESGISLRIATTERGKDGVERTQWTDCVAFGYWGTVAAKARKGDTVAVVGRLQTRQVQKQDGSTSYFTSVVANNLIVTPKHPATEKQAEHTDPHETLGF